LQFRDGRDKGWHMFPTIFLARKWFRHFSNFFPFFCKFFEFRFFTVVIRQSRRCLRSEHQAIPKLWSPRNWFTFWWSINFVIFESHFLNCFRFEKKQQRKSLLYKLAKLKMNNYFLKHTKTSSRGVKFRLGWKRKNIWGRGGRRELFRASKFLAAPRGSRRGRSGRRCWSAERWEPSCSIPWKIKIKCYYITIPGVVSQQFIVSYSS